MEKDEFIAKSLKAIQQELISINKRIDKVEKRLRAVEPYEPDEMLVKNAHGNIELYLIRDEETDNYVDGRVVVDGTTD